MARTIILPTGISIIRKLSPDQQRRLQGGALLCQVLQGAAVRVNELSAELAMLNALEASQDDEVVFLTTDTDKGEEAAALNACIAKAIFGVPSVCKRISGLVLDDAGKLRSEGIPTLVRALDAQVSRAADEGRAPWLSVGGGINLVLPYIAIYGMLRHVPVSYVFEMTGALITLPPLPIDFDWAALRAAERVLGEVEDNVIIDPASLRRLLGESFSRLEGLFEKYDGGLTLSAFGRLVLSHLRQARETPVFLSPSARRTLDAARGTQRDLLELLLDHIRNPLWRAQKLHAFQGTDLEVYKPGNTSHRAAGWTERMRGGDQYIELVYIAELYFHQEYLRDLPGRRRDLYDAKEFTPYEPAPQDVTGTEEGADAFVTRAIRARDKAEEEKQRAEQERNQALDLAAEMEGEWKKARDAADENREVAERYRNEADRLKSQLTIVEAARREMNSWNTWRRLRWALIRRE